jgi:hypothetical protein
VLVFDQMSGGRLWKILRRNRSCPKMFVSNFHLSVMEPMELTTKRRSACRFPFLLLVLDYRCKDRGYELLWKLNSKHRCIILLYCCTMRLRIVSYNSHKTKKENTIRVNAKRLRRKIQLE